MSVYDVFEHWPDGKRLASYDRNVSGVYVENLKTARKQTPEKTYLIAVRRDQKGSICIGPKGDEVTTPPWERKGDAE